MMTSKGLRIVLGTVFVIGIALTISESFAEDIQVVPGGASRTSRVRSAPKRPAPRAASRPTRPRPIQGAPTPVAPPAPRRAAAEEAVNLDALATPSTPQALPRSASGTSMGSLSPHSTSGILPNFKFYFDFLAKSWKGSASERADFSFDSYHQKMMVEFTPRPELMFQADILGLSYFEVDYMLTSALQLRWGRIWIPFDDMSPHSIFGGRMNTSEFFQGNETAFLPNIWADLGMGLKLTLADTSALSSELHFYVVNGFQQGGTSPVAGEGSTGTAVPYPNFGGTSGGAGDNNNDKALGARWHSLFGRRVGLGVSVYRDSYADKDLKAESIYMIGLDLQFRPTNTTEVRAGYTQMKISLDPALASKDSFSRGGSYVELGQRFGTENRWKFLLRAGASQNDNRVVDVSDKTLVGATLLRNFGSIEAQLTYYKDLHQVETKVATNYAAFRLVTAF